MVFRPGNAVLAAACILVIASASHGAVAAALPEGFLLSGVDGTLRRGASGTYIFLLDSPISTDKGRLSEGEELELLASTTLEYMARSMADQDSAGLRLWGTVTLYRGRNYVFPSYYLQLATPAPPPPLDADGSVESGAQPEEGEAAPVINDPNDEIRIPEELMAELKATRRVIDVAPSAAPEVAAEISDDGKLATGDVMVVDRYGIMMQGSDSSWAFRFDGLGRNVSLISFSLLPCEVLQMMEQQMKPSDLEPRRYRIAGIVTRFSGEYYILPTRVTRAYDYGNFAK
jgi:hypothetical protein